MTTAETQAGSHNPTTLTTPSEREIVMTRVFDAPRDLVFKAFTDPLEIKKNAKTGWLLKEENPDITPMERAVRQF